MKGKEGKKSKTCDKCNEYFFSNQGLDSYIASSCKRNINKTFKSHLIVPKLMPRKKVINRHITTVHEGKPQEKEFKCTLCDDAAFTQKHNLTKHIESVHEGKKAFICNICYKRFVQKIHLKRHTKSYHEGKKV